MLNEIKNEVKELALDDFENGQVMIIPEEIKMYLKEDFGTLSDVELNELVNIYIKYAWK